MGYPIATTAGGICFAFPNICNTQAGTTPVPIPYPSIGQLNAAEDVSTTVKVAGKPVILKKSIIKNTTGDEPSIIGVKSGTRGKEVTFKTASEKVKINGEFVVRMTDKTEQNIDNAIGMVLGGEPTVLCG